MKAPGGVGDSPATTTPAQRGGDTSQGGGLSRQGGGLSSPRPLTTPADSTSPPPKTASDLWIRLLDLTANSGRTQSMLRAATPLTWQDQTLTVELASPMRAVLGHRAEEIEKLLRSIVGRKIALNIREPETTDSTADTERPPDAKTLAEESELVKHAMDLFNGRVERAQLKKKS